MTYYNAELQWHRYRNVYLTFYRDGAIWHSSNTEYETDVLHRLHSFCLFSTCVCSFQGSESVNLNTQQKWKTKQKTNKQTKNKNDKQHNEGHPVCCETCKPVPLCSGFIFRCSSLQTHGLTLTLDFDQHIYGVVISAGCHECQERDKCFKPLPAEDMKDLFPSSWKLLKIVDASFAGGNILQWRGGVCVPVCVTYLSFPCLTSIAIFNSIFII